jgi:DNA helicase-2/ATP-dependent DNA helicase PcrA
MATIKVSEVLTSLLKKSGYLDILEDKGEQNRLLNIDELITFIQNWEKDNPGETFRHLLDRISLDSSAADKKEAGSTPTPVFLLTMHNAKGLEFPTVIAAGTNSTYMPFFMRKGRAETEEERRLFYVTSTRAIKQLVISIGSDKPSRFLSQVSRALYSTAYSVEDILEHLAPGNSGGKIGLERLLEMAGKNRSVEEKFIQHPIFGRGKILSAIDEEKYIIEFVEKGQKTIDTSIVPVTFL